MAQFLKSPDVRYSRSITRQPSARAISSEPSVEPLSATSTSVASSVAERDASGELLALVLAGNEDGEWMGHGERSVAARCRDPSRSAASAADNAGTPFAFRGR